MLLRRRRPVRSSLIVGDAQSVMGLRHAVIYIELE